METFEKFIFPLSIKDFLTDYWQDTPLLLNNERKIEDIISYEEIEKYLSTQPLTYPSVRLIGNGNALEPNDYKHNGKGAFSYLNKKLAFKLYEEGNTIVIQGASFLFKGLGEFVHSLEKETGILIHPNIYITPSNSKGFNPHFDTHEVFVYQVRGSKNWNIYDAPVEHPIGTWHLSQKQTEHYIRSEPVHKLVLNEGNVLYIPRGVVHDAFTSDEPSIHITFGFHPLLKIDILKRLLDASRKNSFFRASYFSGFDKSNQENKDKIVGEVANMLDQIVEDLSTDLDHSERYSDTEGMFGSMYNINRQKSVVELTNLN